MVREEFPNLILDLENADYEALREALRPTVVEMLKEILARSALPEDTMSLCVDCFLNGYTYSLRCLNETLKPESLRELSRFLANRH